MKFTKNKVHLAVGTFLVLMGLALMAAAFAAQGHPMGHFSPMAFGPVGILLVLAGVTYLFSKPPVK